MRNIKKKKSIEEAEVLKEQTLYNLSKEADMWNSVYLIIYHM